MTLSELRRLYVTEQRPLARDIKHRLEADPRQGALSILSAIARRQKANRAEGQRLSRVLQFERERWDRGVQTIAGVDEAGMSPFAGPVVAAAVILPIGCKIRHVDDSKKLDMATRNRLALVIKEQALAWAVGRAEPAEIDEINIYHAGLLAMRRAVEGLAIRPEELLVDARTIPVVTQPQLGIIKGDSKSLSIAAASIIAKTTRDNEMIALDATYPGYGFARHKGYPVAEHKAAIRKLGLLSIHRRSFPALQALL